MKSFLIALQFLTIVPVRTAMTMAENDIAKSASAFVFIGIMQGILLIAVDYLGVMVFHHDLVIGLMLLAVVLINGGFHLDGLADTFDGLSVKSSGDDAYDREKRLAVMKDSATGPMGVISIVFSLGLKYLLLKNLSHLTYFSYYSTIVLMPAMSKWAMVVSMFHGRPALKAGLGKIFIERVGLREISIATLSMLALLTMLLVLARRNMPDNYYVFYGIMLVAIYLLSILSVRVFDKKFGGINGDTLGAINEIIETIFLFMAVIWLRISV